MKIAEIVSLSLNFDRDNLSCEFVLILMKGVMPTVVDFSLPGLFRGSHYLQRKRISMLLGNVSGCVKAGPRTTFWGSVTSLRYCAMHVLDPIIVHDTLFPHCSLLFSHFFHVFLVRGWLIVLFVFIPLSSYKMWDCFKLSKATSPTQRDSKCFFPQAIRMVNSDHCISLALSCPLWMFCSALHICIFALERVQSFVTYVDFIFLNTGKLHIPPTHQANIHLSIMVSFFYSFSNYYSIKRDKQHSCCLSPAINLSAQA